MGTYKLKVPSGYGAEECQGRHNGNDYGDDRLGVCGMKSRVLDLCKVFYQDELEPEEGVQVGNRADEGPPACEVCRSLGPFPGLWMAYFFVRFFT